MNKEFIPYEQSLELKELGFDETCFGYYDNIGKLFFNTNGQPVGKDWVWEGNQIVPTDMALAPLYQQAFRWFREKKLGAIVSQFGWGIENEFGQIIYNSNDENILCYEEAELACLKKLIEILKTK